MKSVKVEAALDILKVAAIIIGIEAAVMLAINTFGVADVLFFGGMMLMVFCFYQLYQIRVSQIEYRRKLDEMTETNPTLK